MYEARNVLVKEW